MRTLHRYILSNFLVTFTMALAVLTFVMTVGLVFGSLKYIARGMDAMLVLRFLLRNLPGTLSYSVPVAVLVASLLVFSRLSSDSEISAMRSCGVPLRRIMRTPVLLAVLLSLVCIHVNDNVSPDAAYVRSLRRSSFRLNDITALIEPGRWVQVGVYDIFVAKRDADVLLDLCVNEQLPNGGTREIRAASAKIASDENGATRLFMTDVTVDPWQDNSPGMAHLATYSVPVAALAVKEEKGEERTRRDQPESGEPRRRAKDLPTWALVRNVLVARRYPPVTETERARLARHAAASEQAAYDLAHPEEAAAAAISNAVIAAASAALSNAVAEIREASAALSNAVAAAPPADAAPADAAGAPPAAPAFDSAAAARAVELLSAAARSASATDLTNALAAASAAALTNALAAAAEHPVVPPSAAELEARAAFQKSRLVQIRAELRPRFAAEREISRAKTEIGSRLTLALACLCFVLVGIPLGIQSHRRQSSVGLGISLGVAGAFYFFCITAVSLSKKPELHAHWILVVPVVACLVLSAFLVSRND